MTKDAVVFGVSGAMFGLLAGWIIGSQWARPADGPPAATAASASASPQQPAPPPIDLQRAGALEQQANKEPANATVRYDLGNLYLEAQRPDLAIPWYEAALRINPKDVNVSTDLAVAYWYNDDADRALKQIDHSLSLDAKHAKTLLNQGIIRAFGKRDMDGARESWEKVLKVAPDSPEAARAKQGIEGLTAAHSDTGAASGSGSAGRSGS